MNFKLSVISIWPYINGYSTPFLTSHKTQATTRILSYKKKLLEYSTKKVFKHQFVKFKKKKKKTPTLFSGQILAKKRKNFDF